MAEPKKKAEPENTSPDEVEEEEEEETVSTAPTDAENTAAAELAALKEKLAALEAERDQIDKERGQAVKAAYDAQARADAAETALNPGGDGTTRQTDPEALSKDVRGVTTDAAPAKRGEEVREIDCGREIFSFEGSRLGPGRVKVLCGPPTKDAQGNDVEHLGTRLHRHLSGQVERAQRAEKERMEAFRRDGISNPQPAPVHHPYVIQAGEQQTQVPDAGRAVAPHEQ